MLSALDYYLSPQTQVAIVGEPDSEEARAMIRTVFEHYLPNAVVVAGAPGETPLLADRKKVSGKATAYVCEHFACKVPATDADALAAQLTT